MVSQLRCLALLCVVALLLAGCGGPENPETSPVSGIVTVGGEPMAGLSVTFTPKKEGARAGTGVTDASGKYELTTYGEKDGATIGDHTVTITYVGEIQKATGPEQLTEENIGDLYAQSGMMGDKKKEKSKIPEKYGKGDTSKLTATVKAGDGNSIDFDLDG